ncbi:MAG: hypothetical protein IPM26_07200 [Saprospiraceae bacterium]|nr:hypothetical protein [Saprospiraceae bacterium]
MRITLFQMDVCWQDTGANLAKIESRLRNTSERSDLWVLPEMFNTGYTMQPECHAEPEDGLTVQTLTAMAAEYSTAFCGSIPLSKGQAYFNDFICVNSHGLQYQYSKVHLFGPAGESIHYTPGRTYSDFNFQSLKIRPVICYDLRFPYITHNHSRYDILICVANWPVSRIDHWRSLLIARAIENQCYTIGVNRVGKDALGYEYPGQSLVVDFSGRVLIDMGSEEAIATFTPDIEVMYAYRKKLPFLNDSRTVTFV